MNWVLLKNSLLVSGLTAALATGLGLVAALWLAGLGVRWRNLFLGIAIIALALPPFLVTNCWLHFLGHGGTWHAWLPVNIFSLGGAVWILTLLLWPIPLLAVWSAWRRLEPHQLESDMAVTGWALIRGLLLPLARPALLQAAVLTFVLALNNFAVPALLQIKVFPAEMWVRFNTTFDTAGALRLSLPLVLAPLLMLAWFARRALPWPHLEATVSSGLFRQQLSAPWFWASGAVAVVLACLAVGLPVLQILTVKRTWVELGGALAAGQGAIWNSFWLAALAATVALAIALTFAGRGGIAAIFLLWVVFLMPGVLLGIGFIYAFNHAWSAWLYRGAGIIVLAFVVRYLALGWTTVRHASQGVDRDLVDVARIDGASRWQMLRHVFWPQLRPQLGVAWYIIFLLCLWDVESMVLITPPGGETLALRIFNLLHYGYNAQVNALCLTLLLVAVAPLLLWGLFRRARLVGSVGLVGIVGVMALSISGCSRSSNGLHSQLFADVQVIGSRGVGVGQLNKPRSVAVDNADNLYVVDMTGRVQKFSPAGQFLLSWQMPQTDRGKPKGMCRDRDGNIVVVEPHYSRVNHFTPGGKLVEQWGQHGKEDGYLTLPRAAAVNSRNEIFVSEYQEAERVQKFQLPAQPAPRWTASFGKAGTGPGEFNRPEGLCVDSHDLVHVADSCNHRIEIFSSEGKFLRAFGRPGRGKGELSYPYDICVDAAGRQYVCEFGNSRIQVFDANDQPLEVIGGPGLEPGQFNNPWGVALDSAGNLYVADSQNHRVQKLIRNQKAESRNAKSENQKNEQRSNKVAKKNCFVASLLSCSSAFGFRPSDFGIRISS